MRHDRSAEVLLPVTPLSRVHPRVPLTGARAARPRRFVLAAALCAALTCGAATDAGGTGPGVAPSRAGAPVPVPAAAAVPAAAPGEESRPARGPGLNVLLMGIDRRRGLSPDTKDALHVNGKECDCTDVMMLMHISEDRRHVRVVSIPRDSYVGFARHDDTALLAGAAGAYGGEKARETDGRPADTRHPGKINSAFAHGGPRLAARTVERATGVRVDHWALTDFAGFVEAVDDLGGAGVCADKPMRDKNAGLELAAGAHWLDGRQALRYVRARHVSPPGDLGRVRRQQHLLGRMLTALTRATADDPAALARTALALRRSVRADEGLTAAKLMSLGRQLRGLTARRTEFATVPMAEFDHRVPVWGSTLLWDGPRARALFADLRADRPLTGNPQTSPKDGVRPIAVEPGKVRVEGDGDAAARVARGLRDNGFRVLDGQSGQEGQGEGSGTRGPTRIVHEPHRERDAQALAAALPGAVLQAERGHAPEPTVRVGTEGTEVAPVVFDRSSVEGAPVTGDRLGCGGAQEDTGKDTGRG
ncbi:LCP family protein [Streptomyces daliensis]